MGAIALGIPCKVKVFAYPCWDDRRKTARRRGKFAANDKRCPNGTSPAVTYAPNAHSWSYEHRNDGD